MAKKIATFEVLANLTGFTLLSTDNPKQCVTKEKVLARLKSGYTINLDDFSDKRLIPRVDISASYDWSFFRIKLTLPVYAATIGVYACGRSNATFSGGDLEAFDRWLAAGQRLNAEKYSSDGTQWNIKLTEGKWAQSPYTGNGGYLYLVLKLDSTYYLYGGMDLVGIVGYSGFGALDMEEYLDEMKPIYANQPNLGPYITTLERVEA